MDLARSVQDVCEMSMLRMARHVHRETGERNLCLAGGVALNCVGNGRILREGPFERIWIQPAAGDAGGALGAALSAWYQYLDNPRHVVGSDRCASDAMHGSYLGPRFHRRRHRGLSEQRECEIPQARAGVPRARNGAAARGRARRRAGSLAAWSSARARSAAAASSATRGRPRMQSMMNLKIKFRESFRPFAPSVLRERVAEFFELDCDSPYMLLVAPVRPERRKPMSPSTSRRCSGSIG